MTALIVGHLTHDRYAEDLVLGGPAYYGALTHRALGASVRLCSVVGTDFQFVDALEGIVRSIRRAGFTTTFRNTYSPKGERSQSIDAQAPPMRVDDLPRPWRSCDLLHLAPVMGEVDLVEWKQAVQAKFVGLGIQGWLKSVDEEGVVHPVPWQVTESELVGVDAACLSDEDLTGQGDLLERLVRAVPVVVLTQGKKGCVVIEGRETTRIRAIPACQLDPTGAGDTFAAAFFFALSNGATAIDAARLAARAAAIVVEGRGGTALARVAECYTPLRVGARRTALRFMRAYAAPR